MIRLTEPVIEQDDLDAVQAVLKSGYLVQGANVDELESRLCEITGSAYAVAVSSGTAALHIGLLSLGIGPGDLVATAAYSWIATANVVELCGATPVFVDVDPTTGNMSPPALAQALEGNTGVKAILPVHAFGLMADMSALSSLAVASGVTIVEDAACALGASWHGGLAGSWGTAGCFSFHPRKTVTTGEGGAVVTSDGDLAAILRELRDHGQKREGRDVAFVRPGFNYRMTDLQAALGVTQLAKLPRLIAARRAAVARYNELLEGSPVMVPPLPDAAEPVHQSYVIQLPTGVNNFDVVSKMRDLHVETTIGTWHLPLAAYYRERYGFRPGDFPGADSVFARSLSLPLHPQIRGEAQRQVVERLLSCL